MMIFVLLQWDEERAPQETMVESNRRYSVGMTESAQEREHENRPLALVHCYKQELTLLLQAGENRNERVVLDKPLA